MTFHDGLLLLAFAFGNDGTSVPESLVEVVCLRGKDLIVRGMNLVSLIPFDFINIQNDPKISKMLLLCCSSIPLLIICANSVEDLGAAP